MLLPGHKKVPERALVGAGGHILVGKCSRGGKLLPPVHKKVPERARVGAGRESVVGAWETGREGTG